MAFKTNPLPYNGRYGTVSEYVSESNRFPFNEYFENELTDVERAKVSYWLMKLVDVEPPPRSQNFKKIKDLLWEIKATDQVRIAYCYSRAIRSYVVLGAFKKKKNPWDSHTIEKYLKLAKKCTS